LNGEVKFGDNNMVRSIIEKESRESNKGVAK